jgi:carboxyl-terminal processing protease
MRLVLAFVCGASFFSSSRGDAPSAKPATPLTAENERRNLESFEYVWTTIRDKHWDPKLGGLDWRAIHDEYRPQIEKAGSIGECRAVLMTMIKRLGQSHFGIIPSEVYKAVNPTVGAATANKEGAVGFSLGILDSQAVVTEVTENTPAAKLGVRPGWVLLKSGGQDLAPILVEVRKSYKDSPLAELYLHRAVLGKIQGKAGDKLAMVFRNGKDEEVALSVPLVEPKGARAQLGNLPPMYVNYETRKLPRNIRYFSLNTFFDPPNVMKAFETAVKDDLGADGFILDIRGNPGGIGFMAVGIGGWFVKQPDQKLGTMTTRETTLQFVLNPRLETFDGPLAVLVDGCSASTSEILAGGLQDLKRARIFGSRTAGAALPSVIERLPNGDGFQYAIADYVSAGGKRLEGNGVRPDQEAPLTRKALLDGHDPALEAAVEWIRSSSKAVK